jgi:magnesium-protoporphyrin O-methyltransferase
VNCCSGDEFAEVFDRRTADDDRRRYRRDGPDRTTRQLLDLIRSRGVDGASVLDIGGGIGVVSHELIAGGAAGAVLVDASVASAEAAGVEARERGTADRLTIIRSDFVGRADAIEPADIVTLDRVICCYPNVEGLVRLSATRARRVYGIVLPRDRWLTRIAIGLSNAWFRLRGKAYRAFAHPNSQVDGLVAAAGLRLAAEAGTFFWRVAVFERLTR